MHFTHKQEKSPARARGLGGDGEERLDKFFITYFNVTDNALWGFVSGLTGMRDIPRPYTRRRHRRW